VVTAARHAGSCPASQSASTLPERALDHVEQPRRPAGGQVSDAGGEQRRVLTGGAQERGLVYRCAEVGRNGKQASECIF
jgi:hypothetical protein